MTKKLCFVIARIGEPGSPERRRTKQMMRYVIGPAVDECGYEARLADEIDEPGIITQQIVERLIEAPLVVADLTGHNANVFYELALRHAVRKPLVQLIQQGERIPFDVVVTRTIQINFPDPDAIEESRTQIVSQIKAVEKDSSLVDNPISAAIDLMQMKASGKPTELQTAQILEAIASLQTEVREIKRSALLTSSVVRPGTGSISFGGQPLGSPNVLLSGTIPVAADSILFSHRPNVKSAEDNSKNSVAG